MTDPSSWGHVISKDNPADMLTRWISSKELINSRQWWYGPEWLNKTENFWSKDNKLKAKSVISEIKLNLKVKLSLNQSLLRKIQLI